MNASIKDPTTATPADAVPLRNVRTNIVQSIRAHHVQDLQAAAKQLGHHFFYADLGEAKTKQDVLDMFGEQFALPAHYGRNWDALYDCLTDPMYKASPTPGFIVVVEQIPTNSYFDKESREQLLDIFRDASDYWNDRKIPFRCFYSFCVARACQPGKPERERSPEAIAADAELQDVPEEKLPTDKIADVTPLALRMSSPFNAQYWLAAAQEEASANP